MGGAGIFHKIVTINYYTHHHAWLNTLGLGPQLNRPFQMWSGNSINFNHCHENSLLLLLELSHSGNWCHISQNTFHCQICNSFMFMEIILIPYWQVISKTHIVGKYCGKYSWKMVSWFQFFHLFPTFQSMPTSRNSWIKWFSANCDVQVLANISLVKEHCTVLNNNT